MYPKYWESTLVVHNVTEYVYTVYSKTFEWENFRGQSKNLPIRGKTFMAPCLLTLPIDKAIIRGKTFAIEWKTAKTTKFSPLVHFTVYGI